MNLRNELTLKRIVEDGNGYFARSPWDPDASLSSRPGPMDKLTGKYALALLERGLARF